MRLCDLKIGECGIVRALLCEDDMRRRLMDIGLVRGTQVTCIGRSPSGDPAAYVICSAVIAIRDKDSASIIVKPLERSAMS